MKLAEMNTFGLNHTGYAIYLGFWMVLPHPADTVGIEGRVDRDEREIVTQALGRDQPVERILVVRGQSTGVEDRTDGDRQ